MGAPSRQDRREIEIAGAGMAEWFFDKYPALASLFSIVQIKATGAAP
jgi:hypothetical protein